MLDHARLRGIPDAFLLARGFDIELLSNLVRDGLATTATETMRADNQRLAVANLRITRAGHQRWKIDHRASILIYCGVYDSSGFYTIAAQLYLKS